MPTTSSHPPPKPKRGVGKQVVYHTLQKKPRPPTLWVSIFQGWRWSISITFRLSTLLEHTNAGHFNYSNLLQKSLAKKRASSYKLELYDTQTTGVNVLKLLNAHCSHGTYHSFTLHWSPGTGHPMDSCVLQMDWAPRPWHNKPARAGWVEVITGYLHW